MLILVVKPTAIIKRHIIFLIYTRSQWIAVFKSALISHNTLMFFFDIVVVFLLIFSYVSPFYHKFFCFVLFCIAALTYHIDHSVRTCYWLDINTTGCIHARNTITHRLEGAQRNTHDLGIQFKNLSAQVIAIDGTCVCVCVCSQIIPINHHHISTPPKPFQPWLVSFYESIDMQTFLYLLICFIQHHA